MKKLYLLACVNALVSFTASGELRFRAEVLRGTAADHAREHAPVKEFGLINRVRYRIVESSSALVEREPVAAPDPQKGTLARPAPLDGKPWIRETVFAAPAGAKPIGRGDCGLLQKSAWWT